jgi:Fe-S-cluster containining protein
LKHDLGSFPCTGCGLCCQNIGHIPQLKEFDLGNGVCKFLKNSQCEIYENRPDICQVDKMFELEYHKEFSKTDFYQVNANACNSLQKERGLDKSYRVKI